MLSLLSPANLPKSILVSSLVPVPAVLSKLAAPSQIEGAKRSGSVVAVSVFSVTAVDSRGVLYIPITIKLFRPDIVCFGPEINHRVVRPALGAVGLPQMPRASGLANFNGYSPS